MRDCRCDMGTSTKSVPLSVVAPRESLTAPLPCDGQPSGPVLNSLLTMHPTTHDDSRLTTHPLISCWSNYSANYGAGNPAPGNAPVDNTYRKCLG